MTREEALTQLRLGPGINEDVSKEYNDAVNLAIKALEQVPKLQNRCYVLTYGQMCVFCPYECEHRQKVEPQESEDV